MTVPRRQQISLDHTPFYHCTTRCVRRAFLCGKDRYSGRNFDHRKQWLENRLVELSQVFAIELLAYAIMSNHYHVVIRLTTDTVAQWSDEEVKERWGRVFSLPETVSDEQLALWRERLCSLSWYQRCINEPLARLSNKEDRCKGRFWEGRYQCQALLDEAALVKCMAYVDLNPIRAAIAKTPEASHHTSIKARIAGASKHLVPFTDTASNKSCPIPLRLQEYLLLVDWSGRQVHSKKRGTIPDALPPILKRLDTDDRQWIREMQYYGTWYYRAVGSLAKLEQYCQHLGQQWLKGQARIATATV